MAQDPSLANVSPTTMPTVMPEIPDWAGGDRRALVFNSYETMVPVREEMIRGQLFNAPVRKDLIHRVVHWQLAKRRAGTASTKTRSEVNASGRKIRPQKGTGQSRQGAISSPIFRGGGVVHGPKPRDWSYTLPKNVRRNALRAVLTSKLNNGCLWIVDNADITSPKTKHIIEVMQRLRWSSALIVDHTPESESKVPDNLAMATRNLPRILALPVCGINVYDMLRFNMLVLSKAAIRQLELRYDDYENLL